MLSASEKMMKGKRSEIEESMMTRTMVKICSNRVSSLPDLPYHILELILKRLYFIEEINFRGVCKSFHFLDQIQPRKQLPLHMSFDFTKSKSSCVLEDLRRKKTYTFLDINLKE